MRIQACLFQMRRNASGLKLFKSIKLSKITFTPVIPNNLEKNLINYDAAKTNFLVDAKIIPARKIKLILLTKLLKRIR